MIVLVDHLTKLLVSEKAFLTVGVAGNVTKLGLVAEMAAEINGRKKDLLVRTLLKRHVNVLSSF